jgi:hypothetical protein
MDPMFILYAVLAGFVLGLVSGGSPSRLGRLTFRWGWLIALGMVLQLSLFSTPIGQQLGEDVANVLYILSNAMVLVAVVVNLAIPGLWLVLIGGLSNLVAIVANGGSMPVSAEALAALSRLPEEGYSNSVLVADPRLVPLTDIFAMPTWVPAANVFSIGDVLIGVGAAVVIVMAMHGRGLPPVKVTGAEEAAQDGTVPEPSIEAGARAH